MIAPFTLRRAAITLGLTLIASLALAAEATTVLPLSAPNDAKVWDLSAAPASRSGADAEQWLAMPTGRVVRNVTSPTLTLYAPTPERANGTAVIVAPGGGFRVLAIEEEGTRVAEQLRAHGITAFLLKYRLQATPRSDAEFHRDMQAFMSAAPNPSAMQATPEALTDAQAALRLVRANAPALHIDPQRIGFLGFSAGAMTALAAALAPERDARPNFVAPIYGPLTARDVPADAPPLFTALALDDALMARTSDFGLIASYQRAGRPIEAHLYEAGGHGFSTRQTGKTADLWFSQFIAWMQSRGLLTPVR